jgi:hypothetical protein
VYTGGISSLTPYYFFGGSTEVHGDGANTTRVYHEILTSTRLWPESAIHIPSQPGEVPCALAQGMKKIQETLNVRNE